jgi:hypothetical protein
MSNGVGRARCYPRVAVVRLSANALTRGYILPSLWDWKRRTFGSEGLGEYEDYHGLGMMHFRVPKGP